MLFAPLSLSYTPSPLPPPFSSSSFIFHPLVLFPSRFPFPILYFYARLIRMSRARARTKIGTAQRKWGRLRLVLTYVLYSLSVCYFRLNVCFPASRVYLHRRLAPCCLMNPFFRTALLCSFQARPEISKLRISFYVNKDREKNV